MNRTELLQRWCSNSIRKEGILKVYFVPLEVKRKKDQINCYSLLILVNR